MPESTEPEITQEPPAPALPPKPERRLAHSGRGFLMGTADVVPGVSGGTVALVVGIYPRLINALKSIDGTLIRSFLRALTGRRDAWNGFATEWKRADLPFLFFLGLGIIGGVLVMSRPLEWLLEHQPVVMMALFFGLIMGSAAVPWRMIGRHRAATVAAAIAGTIAGFVLSGLPLFQSPEAMWFIPLAGSIAIIAMILPGVSGAYILVVMGLYDNMLEALNTWDFATILLFMAGALVGLLAFSHILSWLLKHHFDVTLAVLVGVMVGSLRRVWPFKEGGTGDFATGRNVLPDLMSTQTLLALVACLVGITVVVLMQRAAVRAQ